MGKIILIYIYIILIYILISYILTGIFFYHILFFQFTHWTTSNHSFKPNSNHKLSNLIGWENCCNMTNKDVDVVGINVQIFVWFWSYIHLWQDNPSFPLFTSQKRQKKMTSRYCMQKFPTNMPTNDWLHFYPITFFPGPERLDTQPIRQKLVDGHSIRDVLDSSMDTIRIPHTSTAIAHSFSSGEPLKAGV